MPIVVNTNTAATTASFNLSKNADALRKSLARLSSGNRITQPAEDAGGMAVAYKLDSTAKRTEAVLNNHQNALSYLQVQDGALESVGNVLNRMAELRTMAADVTKNANDIENYSKEFRELQEHLNQVKRSKFNGVSLFTVNPEQTNAPGNVTNLQDGGIATDSLSVSNGQYFGDLDKDGRIDNASVPYSFHKYQRQLLTDPSGQPVDGSLNLNVVNLQFVLSIGTLDDTVGTGTGINLGGFTGNYDNANLGQNHGTTDGTFTTDTTGGYIRSILSVSIGTFTESIQRLADSRAENGAEQQRIQSSYELHQSNLVNIEAARGRIMDVDVAVESTRFAKNNVLVQASASMTAQANQLTNVALTLLQ